MLAAVKARPLGVRASGKLYVPAGLDGVCARRPRDPRSGRGKPAARIEQRKWVEEGSAPLAVSLGRFACRGFAEEIELACIRIELGRAC